MRTSSGCSKCFTNTPNTASSLALWRCTLQFGRLHCMVESSLVESCANEWSRYYRLPDASDLEVLHARFVEHRFARHSHEYFVVSYIEEGVQAYHYRQARHVTPAGQMFLVNAGEPHTGEPAS